MATQDFKPRRKPVTYGKKSSNRPLPMYNFLDPDVDAGAYESSRFSEKPPVNSRGRPLQKRSHDAEVIQTTNEDACSGERSPISPNSSTQGKSDHTQNGSTNSSLFDLMSSDEDMDRTIEAQPTSKRRKLTPVRSGTRQVQGLGQKGNAVPKSHDSHAPDIATAQSIETTSLSSGSEQLTVNSKPLPRSVGASKPRRRNPAPRKGAAAKITIDLIDSEEDVRVVSMTSSPTPPHTPVRRNPRMQRSNSSSPSAQLIDQLNRSIPFGSRLTKHISRMAGQTYGSSGVPSPSQLAMRSLRLTPEEAVQSEVEQEGRKVSLEARPLTPSRSRRRLIDALDSPRKQSTVRQIHIESPSSGAEGSINGENDTGEPVRQGVSQTNRNQVEKNDEPRSKPIPALPIAGSKVTYAKQRSHLSDMVLEDLSDFAVPSIAHLVEPVANAKTSVNTSFSSQKSQDEPKDDEDATGGAVRSIHELRQAGENSRFQGNLDSIFEDLEAAGRTGRSRRLRGLMLLTQKFLEPSFCQRFVENGMHQRLASNSLDEADILSSMLTSCALSTLLSSCKSSLKVLQQVFDAVMHSSASLLQETRELSKFVKAIAKDRKQNLSGAMCKDVIEFQQTVLASQMWTTPKPTDITPQLVGLRSVEIAVRGLRELKDFETPLPLLLFSQLVVILEDMASNDKIDLAVPESVLILESTISVLEFSALSHGLLEDGYNEAAKRLCILGPLLVKAEVLPRERHEKIEQLVLRLIISVTNNNGVLCESLGQTALIPAISAIVKKNFLELAEYADSGKALDEPKLESVILALGSLINFAECSQSSRLSMNRKINGQESFVEWLVAAFTRRAGKASEVRILSKYGKGLLTFCRHHLSSKLMPLSPLGTSPCSSARYVSATIYAIMCEQA
jgi:hypothetical protein